MPVTTTPFGVGPTILGAGNAKTDVGVDGGETSGGRVAVRVAVTTIGVAVRNGVSVRGTSVKVADGAGVLLANTNAGRVAVAPRTTGVSCVGASGASKITMVTKNILRRKTMMTVSPR